MKKKTRAEQAVEAARDGKQPKHGLLEKIAQAEVNRQLRREVERRRKWTNTTTTIE